MGLLVKAGLQGVGRFNLCRKRKCSREDPLGTGEYISGFSWRFGIGMVVNFMTTKLTSVTSKLIFHYDSKSSPLPRLKGY